MKINNVSSKQYNFSEFEERNYNINQNAKIKNENKFIDENTLNSIQKLIDEDDNSGKYKHLETDFQGVVEGNETGSDILVQRPKKNFIWGLGQQTNKKKCKIILIQLNLNMVNFQQWML